MEAEFSGDAVRTLSPLSPATYAAERDRLIEDERRRISSAAKKHLSATRLETKVSKAFQSRRSGADTLPPRLVDALTLDTADYQDRGWPRPPAAREVLYAREAKVNVGAIPRVSSGRHRSPFNSDAPTVARYLLAARPLPRVEDTLKIGELMRLAALSQFGWRHDEVSGHRAPKAPWQISDRGTDGKPLRDPSHHHAFRFPEDADPDRFIDHISVFVAGGIDLDVRAKLDRITRLWLAPRQRTESDETEVAGTREWRLALESFGKPDEFAGSARIFGRSTRWRSATPFLAAGHLKSAGRAGEFRRLVKRVGMDERYGFDIAKIDISERHELSFGEVARRVLHLHRFRSRGHEAQHDTTGAFLDIVFPIPVNGPVAFGYGSHFGLGLFTKFDDPTLHGVARPGRPGAALCP